MSALLPAFLISYSESDFTNPHEAMLPDVDEAVTAQRREQSIQDTPIAISAVTADMLDARGQTNIYEVANQVPSVTLKPSVAAWGPSLAASIRGVGQYNFNPALEPGVGVFVDDVYYATLTGSMLDLLDISRVEVLRGPQGTLTGRNSLGGAVRIFTIEPKGDDSGSVELTGGSRNLLGIRASLDVGLTDTLALRVSGMVKSQTGYVKVLDYGCATGDPAIPAAVNTKDCKAGDPQGGIGNQAVRAQLKFTPDDTTDYVDFTASVSITVNQAPTSITWTTPAPITYGTALSGTQLDATSTPTSHCVYTPAAGVVGARCSINVPVSASIRVTPM